jgi:hypothetical protein
MATDMHSVRKEGEYASALLRVGVLFDRTGSGHHGVRWRGYRIRGNCQDLVLFVPGVVPGEFGDAYWQTSLAGEGASDVISDFVNHPAAGCCSSVALQQSVGILSQRHTGHNLVDLGCADAHRIHSVLR